MESRDLRPGLMAVSAFRDILDQPVMKAVRRLLDALALERGEEALEAYAGVCDTLWRTGAQGLGEWLSSALAVSEGPYARLAEAGGENEALTRAARQDVDTFTALAGWSCEDCIQEMTSLLGREFEGALAALPRWKRGGMTSFEGLKRGYQVNGAGLFARYRAFVWEDGALRGVPHPDCPGPEEMLGYEMQRGEVLANTRALVEGRSVNNVLLYGDSGTGKSATVKSLLTVPEFTSLRLIEVDKEQLGDIPALLRRITGLRQQFILFIDDLAFDRDDRTYSVLKTILEGGVEPRPRNVAIYATSNRRHLVRQTFSDRTGDEVDIQETIGEKTSLAERFGVRVAYLPLNQKEFLELTRRLARQMGITTPDGELLAAAAQWERYHPGRTPRVARQFLASLLEEQAKN